MIRITSKKLLIFLLVFSSLIPDLGIKINTFGFNWTFYRFTVLVCILIYLQMHKDSNRLVKKSAYQKWKHLMVGWVIYGAILMVISPYKDPHNGFIEILSIFNGAACLLILLSVIQDEADVNQMISIIYWVYLFMISLGLFEIITGFHLPMSYFRDPTITFLGSRRAATGVFYSENDYSSFITAFVPVMLMKKKNWMMSIFGLSGAVYINTMNDANICLIAMVAGIVFYFVFIKKYGKRGQSILRGFLIVMVVIAIIFIWRNIDSLSNNVTLLNVIRTQQLNAGKSQGSLYVRMIMYADSLKAAVNTYGLGIGPAAFANYFIAHPSASHLVNPHNMYLEVLVEYGLIITVIFIHGIFKLVNQTRKNTQKFFEKKSVNKYLIVCEILLVYCVVCIASSSFIGYAWQWVLIALGIVMASTNDREVSLV